MKTIILASTFSQCCCEAGLCMKIFVLNKLRTIKVLGNIVPLNEVAKECPWIQIVGAREGLESSPKLHRNLGWEYRWERSHYAVACVLSSLHIFTYYPHNSHKVRALWTSSHRSGNWSTGRLSNQLWRVTVYGHEPWQCGSRPSVPPTPQPLCCTAYSYSPPCLVVFNLLWEVKKFSQILQNLLEMYFLCAKGWLPQICPK